MADAGGQLANGRQPLAGEDALLGFRELPRALLELPVLGGQGARQLRHFAAALQMYLRLTAEETEEDGHEDRRPGEGRRPYLRACRDVSVKAGRQRDDPVQTRRQKRTGYRIPEVQPDTRLEDGHVVEQVVLAPHALGEEDDPGDHQHVGDQQRELNATGFAP